MLRLKRAYEPPDRSDGHRILVDRLWPRGLSKAAAAIDEWLKDIAPSTELRRWFGHDPDKWPEFRKRYTRELRARDDLVGAIAERAARGTVTLVYGARDEEHNDAVVLAAVVRTLLPTPGTAKKSKHRTKRDRAARPTLTHIFFDIGGVLGTGGWDTGQRALAAERFDLDAAEMAQRHLEVFGLLEAGHTTLDEYLDVTVFDEPRPFTREEFRAFMLAQSAPFPATIAIARKLAETGRYRLMTINNESAELNVHRLRLFGLADIFETFFSSCWLGFTKPSRRIYELALAMSQAKPEQSVFIDDREQNLPPARALGMHTVRYTSADQLTADLSALGIDSEDRKRRA